MKKSSMILIIVLAFLFLIRCSESDPGESYLKKGDYKTAILKYQEAISNKYADSQIIQFELKQAIAYSKIPDSNGAYASIRRANAIFYNIKANNPKRKELAKAIQETAEIVKKELQNAVKEESERQAQEIEKHKPEIYENAVKLQQRGLDLAALREFRKIPNYKDTNIRIAQISGKLKNTVERLWQEGFALFTAENYSRAIRIFDEILAIDPNHANAKTYKARAEEKQKSLGRF